MFAHVYGLTLASLAHREESRHVKERLASSMADLAKQRVAYEEMADAGVVAVREAERLRHTIGLLEMKVAETEGSHNKLCIVTVKNQYLAQQVQVLGGEVALLKEGKSKAVEEKNGLRRELKATELKLSNLTSDFEMLKEGGGEGGGGKREVRTSKSASRTCVNEGARYTRSTCATGHTQAMSRSERASMSHQLAPPALALYPRLVPRLLTLARRPFTHTHACFARRS